MADDRGVPLRGGNADAAGKDLHCLVISVAPCKPFAWYMAGMSDGDDVQAPPVAKASLKERLSAQLNEYGTVAIVTYFTLSILTIIGFSVAFGMGFSPSNATGVLGVIFAGWAAAKATLPIRILITLGLTPVVALVVRRIRRRPAAADAPPTEPPAPDAGSQVPDAGPQAPDAGPQAPDADPR